MIVSDTHFVTIFHEMSVMHPATRTSKGVLKNTTGDYEKDMSFTGFLFVSLILF